MSNENDSFYNDIEDRKAHLWKRQNQQIQLIQILRELNQKHSLNKLWSLNKNGQMIEKPYYYLKNQFLCSKNKYIDLENLGLRRVLKDQYYGLEVSTSNEKFQIFGRKQIIEEWFNYIKIYSIQSGFKQKYALIKEIGKGAQARVFEIYHKISGKIYAAKVIKKKHINNQLEVIKELQILRQLVHKNIIKLHEVFENKKHIYIILDYLQGGELMSAINQSQSYNEQTVKELIQNLLKTLTYIHSNNIIHRDIKPENLLLRQSTNIVDIVISDFGLSDEYTNVQKQPIQQCGTVGYMAPEILRNQPYDFKVDIFSIGVILFMLLSDSNPFDGDETQEILKNNYFCKINFDLLKIQSISTHAYDFTLQLLQDDPAKRPSAEQALQHDWFILPKMDSQNSAQFSLKNIPKFLTKKKPYYQILQRSPCKIFHNSSFSIAGSSKSNNLSECPSIQDDVLEKMSIEETLPINNQDQNQTQNNLHKEDNLEDMCDDNFYENIQSPSSLIKIYHLSLKGIRQVN